MWLRLFRADKVEPLFKATKVGHQWRRAVMSGKQKRELKHYFKRAGLPFVWEEPKDPNNSAYNRAPKGLKRDRVHEIRLAEIRKNMVEMDEKVAQFRQDQVNNRNYKGANKIFLQMTTAYWKHNRASKHEGKGQVKSNKRSGPAKNLPLGASRGGNITRKERETGDVVTGIMNEED